MFDVKFNEKIVKHVWKEKIKRFEEQLNLLPGEDFKKEDIYFIRYQIWVYYYGCDNIFYKNKFFKLLNRAEKYINGE